MRVTSQKISTESVFLIIILFFCVFGSALSIDKFNAIPIDLYIYYLIIPPAIGIILLRYPTINIYFILVSSLFLIIGVFHVIKGNNSFGSFFKNFIGTSVVYFFYFLVCKNFQTTKIIKYYLYLCIFCSYVALFQYVSYLIGFKAGYDFSWVFPRIPLSYSINNYFRASSIFLEPSHFVFVLSPAIFISINRLISGNLYNDVISKKNCIIILSSLILANSSTGYMAVAFSLLLIMFYVFSIKKVFFSSILFFACFFFLYNYSIQFQRRLNNSVKLFFSQDSEIDGSIDLSSFTLFNNAIVAFSNLQAHPLTGTGIGSHPTAYDKYSLTNLNPNLQSWLAKEELNKEDANSLLLRLISETGILGLILYSIFIIKNIVYEKDSDDQYYWLISNACLVMVLTALLRNGHYFLNGIPLFMMLLYFNKKQFLYSKLP